MARQVIPNTGFWSTLAALINGNFTELYQAVRSGIYDYNDAATQITPIAITAAAGWVDLTNDGAGPFTNKAYAFADIADIYNTTTHEFDFSSLALGDTVDIRLDLEVTTTSPNQEVKVALFMAQGSGAEYSLPWITAYPKSAGPYQGLRFNGLYLGDNNSKNFPAKFKIRSDANATVKVTGWYVRVNRRAQEVA